MSLLPVYRALSAAVDAMAAAAPADKRHVLSKAGDEFLFSVATILGLQRPWARIKDPTGRPREVPVDPMSREPLPTPDAPVVAL